MHAEPKMKKRVYDGEGGGHAPEVLHRAIAVEIREVAAVVNEFALQKESAGEKHARIQSADLITGRSLLQVSRRREFAEQSEIKRSLV